MQLQFSHLTLPCRLIDGVAMTIDSVVLKRGSAVLAESSHRTDHAVRRSVELFADARYKWDDPAGRHAMMQFINPIEALTEQFRRGINQQELCANGLITRLLECDQQFELGWSAMEQARSELENASRAAGSTTSESSSAVFEANQSLAQTNVAKATLSGVK
jgi:hypothetical protein